MPIEISDWYDLDSIRGMLDDDYILTNNLDSDTAGYDELAAPTANDGSGWDPIDGSGVNMAFDGGGYAITDFVIDRPTETNVGLFGLLEIEEDEESQITDLLISGDVVGLDSVAVLVGSIDNTEFESLSKERLAVGGSVEAVDGNAFGLVGDEISGGGNANDCYFFVDVNSTADAAGIAENQFSSKDESWDARDVHVVGDISGDGDVGAVFADSGFTAGGGYFDRGLTNQEFAFSDADGEDWVGFGEVSDTEPNPQMIGSDAQNNLDAYDYAEIWETVEASDEDASDDGYPILQSIDREVQLEAQELLDVGPAYEILVNGQEVSLVEAMKDGEADFSDVTAIEINGQEI